VLHPYPERFDGRVIFEGAPHGALRIADPGTGIRFEGLGHAAAMNPPDRLCQHMKVLVERGDPSVLVGSGFSWSKSMTDELLYNEAQNEVVFVKYLDA
jgi:hypothetical protein